MLKDKSRLRFAVPNKGRVHEPAVSLLRRAGYSFSLRNRHLFAICANADIVFVFVRNEDIPVLVAQGLVDVGIAGDDLVVERGADVARLLGLDFGRCRLCVAVASGSGIRDAQALAGTTIVTSFPHITRAFFADRQVPVEVVEMSGALEIMIGLGVADAIADIVETGDTLRENNLEVLETIGQYETSLIANRALADDPRVEQIRTRLEGVTIAGKYSMLEYNIPETLLAQAQQIAGGYESPTVSHLAHQGWCAVKVLVEKKRVPEVMDRLCALGANAILETEISNCRL